jgi:hypothetical protein
MAIKKEKRTEREMKGKISHIAPQSKKYRTNLSLENKSYPVIVYFIYFIFHT